MCRIAFTQVQNRIQTNNMAQSTQTTQDFVPVQEVRDGIMTLKNGGMRATVMASSLNFALKSSDEQAAILMQFQNFLNSLDFSVQIFVQSKKLDIRPYIALLEDRLKEQTTDLMKIQVQEYIEFIKAFVADNDIMTKSFFVIIPYDPPIISTNKNSFLGMLTKSKTSKLSKEEGGGFAEYRSQLEQRVAIVEQGLARCGVRAAELGTEEVVELLYKLFNPGETEKPMQIA